MAFQEALQRSTTVLIEQKTLVTRVRFPAGVLPGAVVGSSLLGMVIGLCVLLFVLIIVTGRIPPTVLFLPLLLLFQAVFTLGLAWLVSSINVFFRDLQQLIPVGLMVWMYATPIFYSPSMVPEQLNMGPFEITHVHLFLTLNPLHHLIAGYRAIFLDGALPQPHNLLLLGLYSVISLIIGGTVFNRGKRKFADVL
jgi:ABC-type polysaccharide/polyol phosphate export permease